MFQIGWPHDCAAQFNLLFDDGNVCVKGKRGKK